MQFRKNRKTNVLLLFLQIFRTIIQYTTLTFYFSRNGCLYLILITIFLKLTFYGRRIVTFP